MRKLLERADYCVRVGDISLAREGVEVCFSPGEAAGVDGRVFKQRKAKAGHGWVCSETNAFVASDARLCVASWIKHLVALRPKHFDGPTNFLFALSEGGCSAGTRSRRPSRPGRCGWT